MSCRSAVETINTCSLRYGNSRASLTFPAVPVARSRYADRRGSAPGSLPASIGPGEGDLIVNINTASAKELERLPGIGPSLAWLIVAGRPYRTVDELDRVRGIGPGLIQSLRPLVSADGETRKVD